MEPEAYTHDAPSLIWEIWKLVGNDEYGKAEKLVYQVFKAIRAEEKRKGV